MSSSQKITSDTKLPAGHAVSVEKWKDFKRAFARYFMYKESRCQNEINQFFMLSRSDFQEDKLFEDCDGKQVMQQPIRDPGLLNHSKRRAILIEDALKHLPAYGMENDDEEEDRRMADDDDDGEDRHTLFADSDFETENAEHSRSSIDIKKKQASNKKKDPKSQPLAKAVEDRGVDDDDDEDEGDEKGSNSDDHADEGDISEKDEDAIVVGESEDEEPANKKTKKTYASAVSAEAAPVIMFDGNVITE